MKLAFVLESSKRGRKIKVNFNSSCYRLVSRSEAAWRGEKFSVIIVLMMEKSEKRKRNIFMRFESMLYNIEVNRETTIIKKRIILRKLRSWRIRTEKGKDEMFIHKRSIAKEASANKKIWKKNEASSETHGEGRLEENNMKIGNLHKSDFLFCSLGCFGESSFNNVWTFISSLHPHSAPRLLH